MEGSIIFTIDSWYILIPAFIIFLFYIVFITRNTNKYQLGQGVLLISFAIYFLSIIHLVFFPIEVNIGEYANQTPWYKTINVIPILTIDIPTFILNIVMLIPFGMYLPLISNNYKTVRTVALLGLYTSLSFEFIQLLIRVLLGNGRSTDINDLIANTLGAVVGFLVLKVMLNISITSSIIRRIRLSEAVGSN